MEYQVKKKNNNNNNSALGPINAKALSFLADLGRRMA